jgi:hypothetical protein
LVALGAGFLLTTSVQADNTTPPTPTKKTTTTPPGPRNTEPAPKTATPRHVTTPVVAPAAAPNPPATKTSTTTARPSAPAKVQASSFTFQFPRINAGGTAPIFPTTFSSVNSNPFNQISPFGSFATPTFRRHNPWAGADNDIWGPGFQWRLNNPYWRMTMSNSLSNNSLPMWNMWNNPWANTWNNPWANMWNNPWAMQFPMWQPNPFGFNQFAMNPFAPGFNMWNAGPWANNFGWGMNNFGWGMNNNFFGFPGMGVNGNFGQANGFNWAFCGNGLLGGGFGNAGFAQANGGFAPGFGR